MPEGDSFLAERLGLDLADIHTLLNRESGLLGLSELSGDMRELEQAAEEGHAQAQLAIEIFAYRLARQIAGMLVPLNGLDALVFSGGIGENSASTNNVRCQSMATSPIASRHRSKSAALRCARS